MYLEGTDLIKIMAQTYTIRIYLFILLFAIPITALADLRPTYLKVEISAPKNKFTNSELVQINVTLKNTASKRHSILIPGNQSKGLKLIYFSWYKVDEKNFYTEVHHDSRVIAMDTSVKGYVSFKQLRPNESTIIPFFFNDTKNAQKHINSNYEIPKLPPGNYKIIAWYYPWDEEFAKYAFNKFDWEGQDLNPNKNTEYLDLSESGTQSTYFDIEILSEKQRVTTEIYTKECPKHCKFCSAIEHNRWKKVERIIRRQSSFGSKLKIKGKKFSNWSKNHRNVANYGSYPDAINMSLPSFTGIEIIFKNKKGYHYFYLSWQLGKISRIGSRMNTFFYIIHLRKLRIRDSKLNYTKLKYMKGDE